jgi:hypothetical protein
VLVVVDAAKAISGRPQKAEDYLFERLKDVDIPATLILNKVGFNWLSSRLSSFLTHSFLRSTSSQTCSH